MIKLHYLDAAPALPTGVTFGMSWPKGQLQPSQTAHVRSGNTPLPTQTWPLAYWPDGSIKWLGMATVAGPEHTDLSVEIGPGPAPKTPLTVEPAGIEVVRMVKTGAITIEVGDRGRYLIQEIIRGGRSAVGGVELASILEKRWNEAGVENRQREPFAGIIEQLTIEQSGPIRAVIKLTGRYRGEQSGRLMMPFVVRIICYAGCDTVELVHSFVWDGDARRDFIAGLGLKAHVLLHDGVQNRHVRVVGEEGKGLWCEPLRLLPYAGHDATTQQQVQRSGQSVPPPADGGLLPMWNDMQLLQDSCDHAVLRKRQGPDYCWINAEHCRRAPGIMSLSEPAGGLALSLNDFWQAFPASLETSGAGSTEAHLNGWWWSPEAQPMDLRHYGGRDFRPVYEARNPDPAVYSNAYGVARTSQAMLRVLEPNSQPEDLRKLHDQTVNPPLLLADPAYYHSCKVFGPNWAPVDRSTPARAAVEDELAKYMDYYPRQRDRWRWYGFWHYGDFMHTYDPQRHVWHYDQGGRAWDNTELGADIWPWYNFLRSGRADWFRFAQAMTRHVSEVDVFHLGPWTAQGSRHNVVHWGCPCKEPRASQAGPKRFYYFFTADERCRDLLNEVAELADVYKATNVPTEDRVMARIGPTWAAWMANWMCVWERTGDQRWLDKILRGVEGISKAPFGLLQGDPFDYDPKTGAMTHAGDIAFPSNRLAGTMGGAEIWMEFDQLVGHELFRKMLMDFSLAHALDPRKLAEWPEGLPQRAGLLWGYARLMAWAASQNGDQQLRKRAWSVLLYGDGDEREGHTWRWPIELRIAPPALSAEGWRDSELVTNNAATGSLNLMACMAMAPEVLDQVWAPQKP
jgi:hypothetical protein